jgi:hypothetical protein
MTSEDNIVPLFKTFEQLHSDECLIYREHYDNWHAAYRRWDLIKAVLADDDGAELSKLAAADSELGFAKSEAARLKKAHGAQLAGFYACVELTAYLRSLVEKRNARLYGLNALAKRSMRFASAQANKFYGAGAWSLPAE